MLAQSKRTVNTVNSLETWTDQGPGYLLDLVLQPLWRGGGAAARDSQRAFGPQERREHPEGTSPGGVLAVCAGA